MMTYYVTFGQRYRRELHPMCSWVHPDGWVEIEALTEDQAREVTWRMFGEQWAFIYGDEFRMDMALYPRGCLRHVKASASGQEA